MQEKQVADIITKQSNTNFSISFKLLPPHKREAIHTVYAFCRCTDDIVDEGGDRETKAAMLSRWTRELELGFRNESTFMLLNKLSVIAGRFNIPAVHFFDLIHGMQMDLEKTRYETFTELYEYCYKVASTVGLMCSEIFGYTKESTREYAINLGIALQLTNIVRDIASDAKRNRIYIPTEDFERFHYSQEELFASAYNVRFVDLMRFESSRARDYYAKARTKLAREDHKAFFAARIMDGIYTRVLDKIERNEFNVFHNKISISKLSKLSLTVREYFSTPPVEFIASA